jgi:predicted RNase H-like HicB family nuclease
MATVELTARIHQEDGSYWAEVVELPGCFASGDTLDELTEALSEAVSLWMTDNPDAGRMTDPEVFRDAFKVDELRMLVPG